MFDLKSNTHKRFNILTNEWVLVSPHRNKRPWQGKKDKPSKEENKKYDENCFLCPGNFRANGEQNPNYKSTYSFINDYAALNFNNSNRIYESGLLKAKEESGICKVLCFSPDHSLTLPLMKIKNIVSVIQMWIDNYIELGSLDEINHVQIFENKGSIMGCSNPHPHGQIWAQRSLPVEVVKKTNSQKKYWDKNKVSLLHHYTREELHLNERIIHENEYFVALVPFWAIWPYEAMIIPKRHVQSINQFSENEKVSFAEILKILTTKYDNLFETSFPYSAGIHQSPTDGDKHMEWQFHMSFYPPLLRSKEIKKFMVGYEMFANPQRDINAEDAANTLRNTSFEHYLNK